MCPPGKSYILGIVGTRVCKVKVTALLEYMGSTFVVFCSKRNCILEERSVVSACICTPLYVAVFPGKGSHAQQQNKKKCYILSDITGSGYLQLPLIRIRHSISGIVYTINVHLSLKAYTLLTQHY